MTANVRKLALDFALVWFIPFQLLLALMIDYQYIVMPYRGVAYIAGLLLAFQPTFPVAKIPLWRTLPVSRAQIGRARWWQGVGIPGLVLALVMATALLLDRTLELLGWSRLPHAFHADTVAILGCLAGQFLYPIILAIMPLITATLRNRRSPLTFLVSGLSILVMLMLISQGMWSITVQARVQMLEMVSLPLAAILYVTTPRWPMPLLQPWLATGAEAGGGSLKGAIGRGGWLDLCGLVALRITVFVLVMFALWQVTAAVMHLRHLAPLSLLQFAPGVVIAIATSFNATAMRVLRALPATAWQLASYLLLLPLAMILLACIGVMLVLAPLISHVAPRLDLALLLMVAAAGALLIPLALRLNQRWMGLVIPLSMVPVLAISIGWRFVPQPWNDIRLLMAIAAAAVVAGLLWMRAEISNGTRVYRFQPVIAPRWRGGD